jgi:cob(I)alamin adenosyltransferase
MKLYTGSGDRGRTGLFSGERVLKSHPRIEACGDIDELNSILGALASAVYATNPQLRIEIIKIQDHLLHIGAWLSTTPGAPERADIDPVSDLWITFLETAIDRMEKSLPEIKGFIIPGGHLTAAWAHIARSVCRRVERSVVRLIMEIKTHEKNNRSDGGNDRAKETIKTMVYLNRLSDYLFELARFLNQFFNIPETLWKK